MIVRVCAAPATKKRSSTMPIAAFGTEIVPTAVKRGFTVVTFDAPVGIFLRMNLRTIVAASTWEAYNAYRIAGITAYNECLKLIEMRTA